MKSKVYLPFLALAGLILLVGLACITTTTPTAAPPPPVQPTLPPAQPSLPPPPPTAPPTTEKPTYFTEEFDSGIPDWSYFVKHGDESKLDLKTNAGKLVFNITGEQLYVYVLYEPWIYKDARIDVRADNRGKNSNSVTMVCRYSSDGWYEFNIGNDGMWQVFAYDKLIGAGYQLLNSGGSNAIRSGRDVNEYTAICKGNKLSLYINGVVAKSFNETKYNMREGQVGIGVSSYAALPIVVEFDWVTISQP